MDPAETRDAIENEHVIDMSEASNSQQNENLPSSSSSASSVSEHSFPAAPNTPPLARRRANGTNGDLNSGYYISFKSVITLSQIIAAIVVFSKSRHEHPRAPLFALLVAYVCGCVATIPLLFWRFYHRNETSEYQNLPPNFLTVMFAAFTSFSNPTTSALDTRLKLVVEGFAIVLDWFFLVLWVPLGGIYMFCGHSSDAPNLYRLFLGFLCIKCSGLVIPLISYATLCCCYHCGVLFLGLLKNRGATTESINSLPTYKFNTIKKDNKHNEGPQESSNEGGVVAAGTEKERVLSGEDAVCCICLAKYANNDELRELLCAHNFHKGCVDKWLKINAFCPLCKSAVGKKATSI